MPFLSSTGLNRAAELAHAAPLMQLELEVRFGRRISAAGLYPDWCSVKSFGEALAARGATVQLALDWPGRTSCGSNFLRLQAYAASVGLRLQRPFLPLVLGDAGSAGVRVLPFPLRTGCLGFLQASLG